MGSKFGKNLRVELNGTSHSEYIEVGIKGLEIGETFDEDRLNELLARRRPDGVLTTSRIENDDFTIIGCEVSDGIYTITSDEVICRIKNEDYDSKEYEKYLITPRPGHADYPAIMKDKSDVDIKGGGRFSGRLTVGLTLAGGICLQILEKRGIKIYSEILEIGTKRTEEEYVKAIREAKSDNDSVGGILKVTIDGVKAGEIGDSYFEGLESKLSSAIFAIPAIKGISFGAGFRASRMRGSEHNDEYTFSDRGKVETVTNNHGGILGGISTGMPIYFTVSVKPTPSISRAQNTVNLKTHEDEIIEIKGRHDPCIALRMPPILEAVSAMVILDELTKPFQNNEDIYVEEEIEEIEKVEEIEEIEDIDYDSISSLRSRIDKVNLDILKSFEERLSIAKRIGELKELEGLPITDLNREREIFEDIRSNSLIEYTEKDLELFHKIIELSKKEEVTDEPLNEEIIDEASYESDESFGLMGIDITNSLSPMIHNRIGELTNNKYPYNIFQKNENEMPDFLDSREFCGLNVTMPYKRDAISYVDELTDLAEEVGAINTIFVKDGKLIGDNTDYYGFVHSIKTKGISIKGKTCLILGSGGASDSVYLALKDMGASKITRLSHKDLNNDLQNEFIDVNVIVNTTPIGKGIHEGESLINLDNFINLKLIVDINYEPLKTKLILDSKLNRIKCINGLDMLVTQAVCSYEDFMSCELENLEREDIIKNIKQEILLSKNIVLIGMPGSGKTTIGKELARVLNKEFYDVDEMIEYREGISPKEIIELRGEEYFRNRERETCMVLSQVSGAVISTGGGTILEDKNYYSLGKDSVVIYLKKDLDLLDTMNRPLSKDLLNMYSDRTIHYESWKDISVLCDYLSVSEIVDKIIEEIDI